MPLALTASSSSFLGFTTINIYSQIGLITLVGLIAKNGILIVAFATRQRQGADVGRHPRAAKTRLRPILMTTAATVLATRRSCSSPAPARRRNSIGIMLVTGMAIGAVHAFHPARHFTSSCRSTGPRNLTDVEPTRSATRLRARQVCLTNPCAGKRTIMSRAMWAKIHRYSSA